MYMAYLCLQLRACENDARFHKYQARTKQVQFQHQKLHHHKHDKQSYLRNYWKQIQHEFLFLDTPILLIFS